MIEFGDTSGEDIPGDDEDLEAGVASAGADDDLDAALAGARPATAADDGWAASEAGESALTAIVASAARDRGDRRLRILIPRPVAGRPGLRRPVLVGAGLVVAATVAVTLAVALPGGDSARPSAQRPTEPGSRGLTGPRPADMALVGFDSCTSALDDLRTHTAAHVTAYGLGQLSPFYGPVIRDGVVRSGPATAGQAAGVMSSGLTKSAPNSAASHSGTNDQEVGADEPDIVKTDGRRIVSASGGTLRVVDVSTKKVTGTFDLGAYIGGADAQILMSGNRVLVLLGDGGSAGLPEYGGLDVPSYPPQTTSAATTVLLVDISKAQPTLVSMFRPTGALVDARLVDGTARLVVSSAPQIALPPPTSRATTSAARIASYRAQVGRAPLSDWLPTWTVTTGTAMTHESVGCTDLSHPLGYTGLSMTTVYSIDPQAGFGDLAPVSLAAPTGEVYATTSSLYLAAAPYSPGPRDRTWIHRYDITTHKPTYLGSGSVPGYVQDSYSMSDYDGSLRVVTHDAQLAYGESANSSRQDLYVLDAATLAGTGHIPDLGRGEQLYAVRFLGAIGYVVTYERIDPLYVLDLHDPQHPTVAGKLTEPGYSTYLNDVGNGRLLGVGESVKTGVVSDGALPDGLQVSLFDVSHPATPTRVAQIVRKTRFNSGTLDPHAFLYWAPDKLAVLPIDPDGSGSSGGVLALHVGKDSLTSLGTITNPSTSVNSYGDGISRTLLIGDSLWTLSPSGLQASDTTTLHEQAFVPFT